MLFDFSDTINGKNMSNKLIHANSSCFTLKTSLRIQIDQGSKENLQSVKINEQKHTYTALKYISFTTCHDIVCIKYQKKHQKRSIVQMIKVTYFGGSVGLERVQFSNHCTLD